MKLRLNFLLIGFISHVILSETLLNETAQKKLKKSHIGNMPQSHFLQF